MTTTPFQRRWIEISEALGLTIQLSFKVELSDGSVTVPVLLEGFGANKGMLLVTDFDLIHHVEDELVNLGYGYSCLDDVRWEPIDRESIEEMLRDWGVTK